MSDTPAAPDTKGLIAKLRKNRELKVKVAEWTFTALRPTDVEMNAIYRRGGLFSDIAMDSVIDWEGVSQNDLGTDSGNLEPIPFDGSLWRAWCADKQMLWEPIADAVIAAYQKHRTDIEVAEKN